jgi:hypothetical protein
MPTATRDLVNRKSVCFSIDDDADSLLRVMAPRGKGIGMLLSELIRKEARERTQRARMLEVLADQQAVRETAAPALAAIINALSQQAEKAG